MMSQRQIADRLGLSKSRVQQIEQMALEKMRKRLIKKGITLETIAPEIRKRCGRQQLIIDEAEYWKEPYGKKDESPG